MDDAQVSTPAPDLGTRLSAMANPDIQHPIAQPRGGGNDLLNRLKVTAGQRPDLSQNPPGVEVPEPEELKIGKGIPNSDEDVKRANEEASQRLGESLQLALGGGGIETVGEGAVAAAKSGAPLVRDIMGVVSPKVVRAIDKSKQVTEGGKAGAAIAELVPERLKYLVNLFKHAYHGALAEAGGSIPEAAKAEEGAAAAAQTSTAAAEAPETAEDFIQRQGAERATVTPNAEGQAVDAQTGEPIEEEGTHFTKEQQQAAVDKYYEEHPEKKPQPKIIGRGPNKGQVKTVKVFANGKWVQVPQYK